MTGQAPFPTQTPIGRKRRPQFAPGTDPFEGLIDKDWFNSLTSLSTQAGNSAQKSASPSVVDQSASIGTTAFSATLRPGNYRVSWFATVTQAATTSSTLAVTLTFTYRSSTKTFTSPVPMTGNTLGTVLSESQIISVDENSPISWSTTYGSVGATVMKYDLDLILEEMP